MTKQELLELLDGLPDDTEIRLMTQPSWPFEFSIAGAALASELPDFKPKGRSDDEEVLYLVEGRQLAYGTRDAWANV